METIKVKVERGIDNRFTAYMDSQDFDFGLIGYGDTAAQAIDDFYAAYEELKEMKGNDVPDLSFEIFYDMASFLDYFSGMLSKSGLEEITGVNQKQLWHYWSNKRKPKPETVKKIEKQIHAFAESLKQVRFTC